MAHYGQKGGSISRDFNKLVINIRKAGAQAASVTLTLDTKQVPTFEPLLTRLVISRTHKLD